MSGLPQTAQSAASLRARVLVEALPYLRRFRGAVMVVKYGGAAMKDASLADSFARDVTLLQHVGMRPVVVHGGGPEVSRIMERLGLEPRFVDGHRVTCEATAEVAEMVLCGKVNKGLVARLVRSGARAVGLSGTDAGLLEVSRHAPGGQDIGLVGRPEAVDPALILTLLDAGYLPVVAPTADGPGHATHNVNADLVAGALASALRAEKLIYLTDVPGLMAGGTVVPSLDPVRARALLENGTVSGGMRPKMEAALAALEAGVARVHLVDGRVEHALLLEVLTDCGCGTLLQDGEEDEA